MDLRSPGQVKGAKMEKHILVTYASKYGATKQIAEKIGGVLRQAGLQAEVIPVDAVHDISQYKAVILGSAVYIGKWHKGAAEFLQANEKTLADRPVWLFSSGPTGEGDPVELLEGWRLPAALQPVAERIQPRDIAVFHGFINPEKLNFVEKMAIKGLKKPFGDFRDWDAIATWTATVAEVLEEVECS
jgi:menaquinone-dependent protoporphyrinogen oxidase